MNSRRNFIKKATVLASGITILPSFTVSGLGHKAPSDKLNIVGVGIGGKGFANLKAMATEILSDCVMWTGIMPTSVLTNFPKQISTGIGEKCSMNWVIPLTAS